MTTKPRVKKFRVRRSPSASQQPEQTPPKQAAATARPRQLNALEEAALGAQEDGFGDTKFATAAPSDAAHTNTPSGAPTQNPGGLKISAEDEIAAIRKEGLTGRQLRMARRVAQKHGLPAISDFDAVRLLRKSGIDPFQRSTMLELVSAEGQPATSQPAQLPQVVDNKPNLPSKDVLDAASRAKSVMDIQLDISKRRRRKVFLLFTRLAFFVFLPTLLAAYYYYVVATPMYATKSEFVIQKSESGGTGLGGLFSGTGLATSQDSITVQSYLTSREAMLRLDSDVGFITHFSDPNIDPIQRLSEGASNEEAYKLFKKNVKIGFDPSEGIVKMEVIAASSATSALYSEALIRYAEERVDTLTLRKREDQMQGARDSFADAEQKMLDAQSEVLRLQEELGVFDAGSETASIMQQITNYEVQLLDKQLQLQQLQDNTRPNQARVDGVQGDIIRLEAVIGDLRAKLTESSSPDGSLARKSAELIIAQTNVETRIMLMQQALQQLETARVEANKQTRYLSLGVTPVGPDVATYPRAFENTILAFLIFAGIYLMLSLTASILREQISS